jgi:hypothetical protein
MSQQDIDNLKKKLEEQASVKVKKLSSTNTITLDNLSKIMEAGSKEFTEKTGRPMTYSEMREMYG